MLNYIRLSVIIIALIIASYTDIKENRINKFLLPIASVISLGLTFFVEDINSFFIMNHLLGAIEGFWVFYVCAILFKGGGADIIIATSLGMVFGSKIFLSILIFTIGFAFIVALALRIIKKGKIKTLPLAPFFLIGTVLGFFIN